MVLTFHRPIPSWMRPSAARQRRARGAVDGRRSKGAGRGSRAAAVTRESFARRARAVPPLSPARPRCVRNRWVARSRARRRGEEGIRLPTRGDLRDWEARDRGESSIVPSHGTPFVRYERPTAEPVEQPPCVPQSFSFGMRRKRGARSTGPRVNTRQRSLMRRAQRVLVPCRRLGPA